MSLVRFNPIREVFDANRRMDRMFSNMDRLWTHTMPIDIIEAEDEFSVIAELPGFNRDEIEIEVTRDSVTIKAEHMVESEEETEENEETYKTKLLYSERRAGKYARKLNFGKEIDASKATSTLENGILTITLPIAEKEKAVKLTPELN